MRDTVVIVGCGLMGSGIAACSALAGNPTILIDVDIQTAEKGKNQALLLVSELLENGLATQEQARLAKDLLSFSNDPALYKDSASMVIEAIYENLEAKQKLFKTLDEIFPPEVVILSNTSGLRITDIAAKVKYPQRTLTAHFWFPAHLVPLVEVVVGDKSDAILAEKVRDTLIGWGKAPVIVKKDLPGQLANRILQAVIRESINIVDMGLASPEDVDTAVKMGMGIRFPVWGPLEHIEMVGLDLALNVQKTVLPEISGSDTPSPYLESLVNNGKLGYKTKQGFYDWTVKDMDALAERRNAFIILARNFMKENPE